MRIRLPAVSELAETDRDVKPSTQKHPSSSKDCFSLVTNLPSAPSLQLLHGVRAIDCVYLSLGQRRRGRVGYVRCKGWILKL